MATVTQATSLSLPARLLCYIGPPTTILLTSLASPRTGLFSPLAFVPSALGFVAWRKANKEDPSSRASLEPLIWTLAGIATLGLAAVMIPQLAILTGTARLLFPDPTIREAFMEEFARPTVRDLTTEKLAVRFAFASSWRNWVFNTALSFNAGVTEEALKLAPILLINRKAKRENKKTSKRAFLDHALAAGLGFSLVEGIMFLYAATQEKQETGWILARTIAERFVAGSLAHVLYAALTGLRATRKVVHGEQITWLGVLTPSILLHGIANTLAFTCSTLQGNVGWIHPTGLRDLTLMYSALIGINGFAGWLVRKEWREVQVREVKDEAKNS